MGRGWIIGLLGWVACQPAPAVAPSAPEPAPPTVRIPEPAPVPDTAPPEPKPAPAPKKPEKMTAERLGAILETMGEVAAERGVLLLSFEGATVTCLTDETHDRMRFVVPILETSTMTVADKDRILEANFHTALDARYAVFDGILFSAFIHPLSTLDEPSARAGVRQVVTLAKTYGTTYNSGGLMFAPP